VIADQDELAVDGQDGVEKLGDVARGDHASLVNDEHTAGGQQCAAGAQVGEQRERAGAADSGTVMQLRSRAAGGRHAEDRCPAACHASLAPPSANVLPVRACRPTRDTVPSPHSRPTAARCSP